MNHLASNSASGAELFNIIFNKAKTILLTPAAAWEGIKSETESVAEFYKSYLIYMAAIGPVCSILGNLLFSVGHLGLVAIIVISLLSYVIALVMPYVMGLVSTKVASMCSAELSLDKGVRLVGYASTAVYIAGLLSLVPFLSLLSILFMIYVVYTLHLGATRFANIPESDAVKFTAIMVVAYIVVSIIASVVIGIFTAPFIVGSMVTDNILQ